MSEIPSSSAASTPYTYIEWLAQNCYIEFADDDHEYRKDDWYKDEEKVG